MRATKLAAAAIACAASVCAHADSLDEALASIERQSGGTLGVSVLHVKSGERVRYRADERFPMASTFKVPLAMTVLAEVDNGAIDLRRAIPIDQRNLSPGSGELKSDEPDIARTATVAELLKLALRNSDNTASDHLLALVGGPAEVTRHVRALGIEQLRVDRPAMQLVADAWGVKLPAEGERTRKNLARALGASSPAGREKGAARMLADPRDTTTPDAMAATLERLVRGTALAAASTELLLDHMANCRTGTKRIKGDLPRGVPVAHKSGKLTRVATNDVGVITLPWSGGPLVVAIYLKGSPQPLAAQERHIAAAALAIYRRFS